MSEENSYSNLRPLKSPRQEILEEALRIVSNDRANTYGLPEHNLERIARSWRTTIFNKYGVVIPLTGGDVALLMIDMKIARLANTPDHKDSWTDIAGYAAAGYQAEVAGTDEKP